MSLYAIKNGRGEWYDWNDREFWPKDACAFVAIGNHEDAERMATEKGGHVVELVEAQAKIVVSQEEDKVLKKAKNTTMWRPASVIAGYAYEHEQQGDDEVLLEDRLMRAYVIGWVVDKPKRYLVYKRLPGKLSSDSNDSIQAHKVKMTQGLVWRFVNKESLDTDDYFQFTDAEIEHYGLQDCERIEVTEDDD